MFPNDATKLLQCDVPCLQWTGLNRQTGRPNRILLTEQSGKHPFLCCSTKSISMQLPITPSNHDCQMMCGWAETICYLLSSPLILRESAGEWKWHRQRGNTVHWSKLCCWNQWHCWATVQCLQGCACWQPWSMAPKTLEALMFIKANLKEGLWNDIDWARSLKRFTKKEETISQEEWWKDWEQHGDKEDKCDQREGGQCSFCPHCEHL